VAGLAVAGLAIVLFVALMTAAFIFIARKD
jgi:hypothetical protein